MEHPPLPQQLVHRNTDEKGGLSDPMSREDDTDVAGAETSVEALLEQT
jgi:hypothetical protein